MREAGSIPISAKVAARYARAYGVSNVWLYEGAIQTNADRRAEELLSHPEMVAEPRGVLAARTNLMRARATSFETPTHASQTYKWSGVRYAGLETGRTPITPSDAILFGWAFGVPSEALDPNTAATFELTETMLRRARACDRNEYRRACHAIGSGPGGPLVQLPIFAKGPDLRDYLLQDRDPKDLLDFAHDTLPIDVYRARFGEDLTRAAILEPSAWGGEIRVMVNVQDCTLWSDLDRRKLSSIEEGSWFAYVSRTGEALIRIDLVADFDPTRCGDSGRDRHAMLLQVEDISCRPKSLSRLETGLCLSAEKIRAAGENKANPR